MPKLKSIGLFVLFFSLQTFAAPKQGKYFDRVIFVVFENTNYSAAMAQPFFKKLSDQGASFSNFLALTHPSQGNYIALTSGSLNGVRNDNPIDLDVSHVGDLMDAKNVSWKVYAEGYPGNCFTGKSSGQYVRKHVPFISYLNIQRSPSRCANIVNANQFDQDAANGTLPQYVFYVPDMKNDGHDTGVSYANNWYQKRFTPFLNDSNFMKDTILVTTFDESGASTRNQIYTSIVGPGVKAAAVADALNIYSLLKLIEDNWSLGDLGLNDSTAKPIPESIWK